MTHNLRERARERLHGRAEADPARMDSDDVQRLVEELRIHQFELEIQNEELRETQVKLAESRDRYRTLYDFAPVGYCTLDGDNAIAELNRAAGEILGSDRERLAGARFTDFVAPESVNVWRRHRQAAQAHDEKQSCELALHNVGGDRWFIQLQSQADAVSPGHAHCALIDISDRKRAERELERLNADLERRVAERTAEARDNEARMRAILDTMSSAVVTVTDGPGRIERANPAAQRIFGSAMGELAGRPFGPLLPQPYRAEYERHLQGWSDRSADNIATTREIAARRRDGSIFPAEVAVSLVDEAGLFIVAIRDLSESRRLQNEVLNASEDERFRISSELHDGIGQQLAGLSMMAERLARRRANSDESADSEEAEALAELSRELQQAVASLRAAVHDLTPMDLEGRDLPSALGTLARESGERSGVRCTFLTVGAPPEPDPRVGVQLLRIADEAVHNALAHGDPKLVGIELEKMEGGGIMLTIHDDGTGMPADSRQHPGQHPTRDAGMGMRTMRYRAGVVGANLEIGNRPEGGARVRCTLPAGSNPAGTP